MLATLNILFWVFHTGLVVFNVFGWMWSKTRRWNLITQCLTLASWIGMGAFYGFGYCLCTDYHWQIRKQMGITDDPPTYVGLLIRNVTGVEASPEFVFWITATLFIVSFIGSISSNVLDYRRRKGALVRL